MSKTGTRQSFTREYKIQAVKLITEQGYSCREAARYLGIREQLIRTWKKQFAAEGEAAFPGHGVAVGVEAELQRLRAEVKRLQLERDILKKAAAFFAREST
jgi:transposase